MSDESLANAETPEKALERLGLSRPPVAGAVGDQAFKTLSANR